MEIIIAVLSAYAAGSPHNTLLETESSSWKNNRLSTGREDYVAPYIHLSGSLADGEEMDRAPAGAECRRQPPDQSAIPFTGTW